MEKFDLEEKCSVVFWCHLIRKALAKETDMEAKTKKLENTIRYEIGSNINAFLKVITETIYNFSISTPTLPTK